MDYGMILIAFIVMLGPLKFIGSFVKITADMDEKDARSEGSKGVGLACIGGVVAAFLGQKILLAWGIPGPALHLAAGLILLLVALNSVMAQYQTSSSPLVTKASPKGLAFSPIAFPMILAPHGIAIFILLMSLSNDFNRDINIILIFLAVMLLNWIFILFARPIMRRMGLAFSILGAILSVLQVALAIKMMINAIQAIRSLPS